MLCCSLNCVKKLVFPLDVTAYYDFNGVLSHDGVQMKMDDRAKLHSMVFYAKSKLIKSNRTIRCSKGNKERGALYALRPLAPEIDEGEGG